VIEPEVIDLDAAVPFDAWVNGGGSGVEGATKAPNPTPRAEEPSEMETSTAFDPEAARGFDDESETFPRDWDRRRFGRERFRFDRRDPGGSRFDPGGAARDPVPFEEAGYDRWSSASREAASGVAEAVGDLAGEVGGLFAGDGAFVRRRRERIRRGRSPGGDSRDSKNRWREFVTGRFRGAFQDDLVPATFEEPGSGYEYRGGRGTGAEENPGVSETRGWGEEGGAGGDSAAAAAATETRRRRKKSSSPREDDGGGVDEGGASGAVR
jgi:hypothetical protein